MASMWLYGTCKTSTDAFGVKDPWVVVGHSWGSYTHAADRALASRVHDALVYISGTGTPSWWNNGVAHIYKAERDGRMSLAATAGRVDQLRAVDGDWDEEVEFRRLSWITDFADRDAPPEALDVMASTRLAINWEVNRAFSRHAAPRTRG